MGKLRSIWVDMIRRCTDPKRNNYNNYGGRGIKVCEEWRDFSRFVADMGEPPPGKSLDRIDNDGPYAPHNCRWASAEEQASNRRNSRVIYHRGEALTIAQWARKFGVGVDTMHRRITSGMPLEKALVRGDKRLRPVVAVDAEGNECRFECVADAVRATGIGNSAIHNCLAGRCRTSGGFRWRYDG